MHQLSGKEIKFFRRSCGDGKKEEDHQPAVLLPSLPIPSLKPQNIRASWETQDFICPHPVWEVEETVVMEEQFQNTLNDKAPTKQKRREFAKQNMGNMGRHNICGTPLVDFHPGTAFLGFRSAETLCLRWPNPMPNSR